jgi:hypothetical protein
MRSLSLSLLVVLALARPCSPSGTEILLDAHFDGEPLDQPIATGGAAVGEPTSVTTTITAVVHAWPMATPSVKINDDDAFEAGFVRFQFIDDQIIESGTLTIRATIWFQAYEEYTIRVRELRIANSRRFLDLGFGSSGIVGFRDQDTTTPRAITTFDVHRPVPLVIAFDMDAATYDVEFDGVTVLDDEPHGVTPYGIGAILFGHEGDEDDDGEFSVDDLLVTWQGPSAVEPESWAAAKASYR